MAEPNARLTPLGKIISLLLIVGLIGVSVFVFQKGWGKKPGGGGIFSSEAPETEAPDTSGVTTVKEYKYIATDRLPAVKGVSQYQWDPNEKIVHFTYNVWAGWLPVIAANGGTKPNADSVFAKKYGFRVQMDLMDDPVAARDAFAAGKVHTLWGTADMIVLMAPELIKDSRTAPRVVQQIDWSNGGDGIVVRSAIKSVADLRGKSITLAQNSPSEYYLMSLLLSAGMSPKDVSLKPTATAFEAAAAFVADKKVNGCVSWAPDIYNIPEKVAGTRILSTTKDASKLIADVYAIRADFVRDHPEVVEGLVAGIFEGMDILKDKPEVACKAMADAFGMKPEDVMGMRNDFHSTNFAENQQFFLNSSNPTNFERTWKGASFVYRELGRIDAPVPFDQVMDFSFIQTLQKKGTFAHQKDESIATFTPSSFRKPTAEAPLLTQTIRINFYPNSSNPYEPAHDDLNNPIPGKLYDPNVDATLERVARLVGQFSRAVILIEGHTDSSMKGRVPSVEAVRQLSQERAEAIRRALIDKYKFDPNKFTVLGKGWDVPADPQDPGNQAMNRRVEISVFPPEQK
jgi:NitT/TauT family transport system substrate-binding protein